MRSHIAITTAALICFTHSICIGNSNFSIKDAIRSTLNTNEQIKSSEESVNISKTDKYRAILEFAPNISVNSAFVRNDPNSAQIKSLSTYDKNIRTTDLIINQPIFSGASTISNIRKTKDIQQSAEAQFLDLQNAAILATVQAYESVRTAKDLHELNSKNEKNLSEYLELTKIRYKYQAVTKTDVLQVEARLATATANKINAYSNLISANANFEHIIGIYPPESLPEVNAQVVYVPTNSEEYVNYCLKHNFELKAQSHAFEASRKDIDLATSRIFPNISAQARYNKTDAAKTSLTRSDGNTYSINLSIPIFQSGIEYADIKKAKHVKEQARHKLQDTKQKISEEAIRAWEAYYSSKMIVLSTQKAIDAAKQAYEGVLEEAKAGTRTNLNVLDAELELFSAQVQHRKAKADAVIAIFALHKVSGDLYKISKEL